jgi:uncharacterized membrane protein
VPKTAIAGSGCHASRLQPARLRRVLAEGGSRRAGRGRLGDAIAGLRAEHDRQATPLQKIVERFTARAGSSEFVVALSLIIVSWIVLNTVLLLLGKKPIDEPPFFWMQGAVSLAALYMTVLILATQRREKELASHHEHLTLELAVLSEQKAAKIISLLEELRQDHPEIHDRIDDEAAAMSEPTDPQSVLETIKKHTAR